MNTTEISYEVRRVVEKTQPADALEGIEAARRVAAHADALARDFARRARGQGDSWAQIADKLGIDQESTDPAADAFLWVAPEPPMPLDSIRVRWTCASCGAAVVDSGPYGGHPDDTEDGHTTGCERHQGEVREYMRLAGWDAEDVREYLRAPKGAAE